MTEKSSSSDLSEARKVAYLELKNIEGVLKSLDLLISPKLGDILEDGKEEKFAGFWIIRRGARRFNESFFRKNGKKKEIKMWEELKDQKAEIEDKYKIPGNPCLYPPKN